MQRTVWKMALKTRDQKPGHKKTILRPAQSV